MSDTLAKTMAVIVALLLAGTLAVLIITTLPPVGASQVVAQFRNAFPLIQGMHVRVDGAIAGKVGEIGVNDEGLAEVTLLLDDTIEAPTANATAAIRQQDTTGDSYVAYDPGTASEPLPEEDGVPTIACNAKGPNAPCANTLAAPRFDDLLNAFGPRERTGVRLILVELAKALDQRGADVNRAAVELLPAIDAADQALTEVNSQNAALKAVIADAEAVTSQAASKRRELGHLIGSLESTLAVTASSADSLDAGLERLPATLSESGSALTALRAAALQGRPLAEELLKGAPELANALQKAPGFLEDTDAFLRDVRPTLEKTEVLAKKAAPTIAADPERVVTGPFDLGPALSNLLTGVLGDKNTFEALFGDDSGGEGPGTLSKRGLGAVSVEPANQIGYPANYENRNMARISGLINCEVFGLPVTPGCLSTALSKARAANREPAKSKNSDSGGKDKKGAGGDGERRTSPAEAVPGVDGHAGGFLGGLVEDTGRRVRDGVDELGDRVRDGVGRLKGGLDRVKDGVNGLRGEGRSSGGDPLKPLLDFLLR